MDDFRDHMVTGDAAAVVLRVYDEVLRAERKREPYAGPRYAASAVAKRCGITEKQVMGTVQAARGFDYR